MTRQNEYQRFMVKERDYAIDFVKCLATLLIINSHADIMYPHLKVLATGGAIGDCLFLFCSGFTLLIGGGNLNFGSYYKRRISRIYPSIFATVFFGHLLSQNPNFTFHSLTGGQFVTAIMIYYILLFFIGRYAREKVPVLLAIVAIVSLVVYIFWFPYKYEISSKGLYGVTTTYRWIPYFGAMLLGAYIGMKRKSLRYNWRLDSMKLVLCLLVFYGIQMGAKLYRPMAPLQVITLLPLIGILFYIYKTFNSQLFAKIYNSKSAHWIVMFVGGLCLESYLVQSQFFTDKMNDIWPLNLILVVVVILAYSYVVRCIARIFQQTFRTENYEWRKVFAPF